MTTIQRLAFGLFLIAAALSLLLKGPAQISGVADRATVDKNACARSKAVLFFLLRPEMTGGGQVDRATTLNNLVTAV